MDSIKRCIYIKAGVILTCGGALCLLAYVFVSFLGPGRIDDMDTSSDADPCVDFYQFACEDFAKNSPPGGFTRFSNYLVAVQTEDYRIEQIVLEAKSQDDIKPLAEMKLFIKTCLDYFGESGEASGCVEIAKNIFRRALRWKYMEEKVDQGAKEEIGNMVKMILEAFKTILKAELDSEAKVFIKQIDGIRVITVEEKGAVEKHYEGLELTESYLENELRISTFLEGKDEFGIPREDATLFDSGAAYYPSLNLISISGAIFQPPFFGKKRPRHQNYARLGFYIAHEIAHSLQYSYSATFPADFPARFSKKIKCVTDKYREFSTLVAPFYAMNVNGELTAKENIVDIEGLRVSWRAYQNYVSQFGHEVRLRRLEQFSNEQLFFVGYAKAHCESIMKDALLHQIRTDPHSPAEFRVNGPLQHFHEFAKAFNCPVDENGMNPPEKCVEW